ncbi:hypothetical protein Mapa_016706 [Marchantia paleacea]|nr:hypothetical protein Mapa_016706 [Marchantia paleacea]
MVILESGVTFSSLLSRHRFLISGIRKYGRSSHLRVDTFVAPVRGHHVSNARRVGVGMSQATALVMCR